MPLDQMAFCATRGTRVTLVDDAGRPGFDRVPDTEAAFVWRLDPERAAAFAELVDDLAKASRMAGSEILECTQEEEIVVKVSRGEYTDAFLR